MQATVKHVISFECKNNTENVDPKTKNGRTIKNKKKIKIYERTRSKWIIK